MYMFLGSFSLFSPDDCFCHGICSFIGPLAVARGSYEVGLSLIPFFCFLGIVSLDFSKVWHSARNWIDRAGFSGGKNFCPRNWENGPKTWVFEFTEKIGH